MSESPISTTCWGGHHKQCSGCECQCHIEDLHKPHARCLNDDCPCFADGERAAFERLGDLLRGTRETLEGIQETFDEIVVAPRGGRAK